MKFVVIKTNNRSVAFSIQIFFSVAMAMAILDAREIGN